MYYKSTKYFNMKNIIYAIVFTVFIALLTATLISFGTDCKHIYVASQPAKVEWYCKIIGHSMLPGMDNIGGMGYLQPEPGTHERDHDEKNVAEGIELVCVKCFHETRQEIHYRHKE
jgi:hypothetical protein